MMRRLNWFTYGFCGLILWLNVGSAVAAGLNIEFSVGLQPSIPKESASAITMNEHVDFVDNFIADNFIKGYEIFTLTATGGVERDYFNNLLLMIDPQTTGTATNISEVGWDGAGRLQIRTALSLHHATDAGFLRADHRVFSKYLQNHSGIIIGTVSLSEGRNLSLSADFDFDNRVDFMQSIDLERRTLTLLVGRSAADQAVLEEYLQGVNVFCTQGPDDISDFSETPLTQTPASGTVLDACGEASGTSVGSPFSIKPGGSHARVDSLDQLCMAVLSQGGSGNSWVLQPPPSVGGTPAPRSAGESVAKVLKDAGADLMEWGRAAGSSGVPAAATISVIGAALRYLGEVVEWGSSEPLAGEEGNQYLSDFCENFVKAKGSHSVDAINEAANAGECGNPAESASINKFSSHTSSRPFQPEIDDPLADQYCRDPETFTDMESLMGRLSEVGCDDQRTSDSGVAGCNQLNTPRTDYRLDYSWTDVAAPKLLEEVEAGGFPPLVNPGEGRKDL